MTDSLFDEPCCSCGAIGHGFLANKQYKVEEKWEFSCPILHPTSTVSHSQHEYRIKYTTCPEKFAEAYGFNQECIEEALEAYDKRGDGQRINPQQLQAFKDDVRERASEARRRWISTGRTVQYVHLDDPGETALTYHKEASKNGQRRQIFCDLDGVLADFEEGVRRVFRKEPRTISPTQLWTVLAVTPEFYTNLPWMKGGERLWEAIKGHDPVIITAAPRGSWAGEQKREWVRRHLGPWVEVIVTTRKYEHCPPVRPAPILIDDRMIHCQSWQSVGGEYIKHEDVDDTIRQLHRLGVTMDSENEEQEDEKEWRSC